jgi:hypothetical protein
MLYEVILIQENDDKSPSWEHTLGVFNTEEKAIWFIENYAYIPNDLPITYVKIVPKFSSNPPVTSTYKYVFELDVIEPTFEKERCWVLNKDIDPIHIPDEDTLLLYAEEDTEAIERFISYRRETYLLGITLIVLSNDVTWQYYSKYKGYTIPLGIGKPSSWSHPEPHIQVRAFIPWDSNIKEVEDQMLAKVKEYQAGRFSF